MLRPLVTVLASLAFCGCFIADELDKADTLMDQNSPTRARAAKAAKSAAANPEPASKPASGNEGPGIGETLQGWWQKATTPAPTPPDKENVLVRCELGGASQFMRKYDCQLRGGRVTVVPPANDAS